MPPTIKTRFSLAYFSFNLGSFRADPLRAHEDSAEKSGETLRGRGPDPAGLPRGWLNDKKI